MSSEFQYQMNVEAVQTFYDEIRLCMHDFSSTFYDSFLFQFVQCLPASESYITLFAFCLFVSVVTLHPLQQ